MQQGYLKQKGTGIVFVWTEILAKREDMIPYSMPEKNNDKGVDDGSATVAPLESRALQIISGLLLLDPNKHPFLQKKTKPTGRTLGKALGIPLVTVAERDEAWKTYLVEMGDKT